jgi:hypothetical protein
VWDAVARGGQSHRSQRHRAILIQRRDDFDASLEAHADATTKVRPIEGATQFVVGEFLHFLDIRLNVSMRETQTMWSTT